MMQWHITYTNSCRLSIDRLRATGSLCFTEYSQYLHCGGTLALLRIRAIALCAHIVYLVNHDDPPTQKLRRTDWKRNLFFSISLFSFLYLQIVTRYIDYNDSIRQMFFLLMLITRNDENDIALYTTHHLSYLCTMTVGRNRSILKPLIATCQENSSHIPKLSQIEAVQSQT